MILLLITVYGINLGASAYADDRLYGSLVNFANSPMDPVVGRHSVHIITFSIQHGLPQGAKFHFDFQQGFDFNTLLSAEILISGSPMSEYIDSLYAEGQIVALVMDPGMPAIPPGSPISISLDNLGNDLVAGPHFAVGWTSTSSDSLIDGPTVSLSFDLIPDTLFQITITPGEDLFVRAGAYVGFEATGFDQFGNAISNLDFDWSVNPDSCGVIDEGLFFGNKVGQCLISAIAQGITGISGTITVAPGELGDFIFLSLQEETVAGSEFADSIGILIKDVRGNRKTDFNGYVHFTSTDEQAQLYWDSGNQFHFQTSDSGLHYFAGAGFVLRTAGIQTLAINHMNIIDESPGINVIAGAISDFDIVPILETITAGADFTLTIEDARDSYGNVASGLVRVVGHRGVRQAPNGIPPSLADISIINGNGLALQRLVAVDTAVLRLYTPLFSDTTAAFFVHPGDLTHLILTIPSPQISGNPFTQYSQIAALDQYLNMKIDMNAHDDTVMVLPATTSSIINNIFSEAGDFTNGVCDLNAQGTTYYGPGGWTEFLAVSPSIQDTAHSVILVLALQLNSFSLENPYLFVGDWSNAAVQISNPTSEDIILQSLIVMTQYQEEYITQCLTSLPDTINAEEEKVLGLRFYVPIDPDSAVVPLKVKALAEYNGMQMVCEMANYPDTGYLAARNMIRVNSESLEPDSVLVGYSYSFRISIEDTFSVGIDLDDSSSFVVETGLAHSLTAFIMDQYTYIPPGGQLIELAYDSVMISSDFDPGSYAPYLTFYGNMGNLPYIDTVAVEHSILISGGSIFSYEAGSVEPDSVVHGFPAAFSVNVINSGPFSLIIDPANTRFMLNDGVHFFEAGIDTAHGNYQEIFEQGAAVFNFESATISDLFELGEFSPTLELVGIQNGTHIDTLINLHQDSIRVLSPGIIVIDTTFVESPNSPYVNTGQSFQIVVQMRNTGTEGIRNIVIKLQSNGSSQFADSLIIDYLPGSSDSTHYPIDYQVTADLILGREDFQIASISGVGEISGSTVDVEALPEHISCWVEKQTPASVAITNFDIVNGIGDPDSITIGHRFSARAVVSKSGEAGVTGSMKISLDFSSADGFEVADSLTRDFDFDFGLADTAIWQIDAATIPGEDYRIKVAFAGSIMDANDGQNAIGADSTAILDVIVIPGAFMDGLVSIADPAGARDGVLSTDQFFIVKDTIQWGGEISDFAATIFLPPGYFTADSTTKAIQSDTISWRIRSPEDADPSIRNIIVCLNGTDRYSGESLIDSSRIEVYTIDAADLQTDFKVASPESAIDRILDPVQQFTLSFICENIGQAGALPGIVEIKPGQNGFILYSNSIQQFEVGQEVAFTLRAPPNELLNPVNIWIEITDVPDDSNTNIDARISRDSLALQFVVKNLKPDLIVEGFEGFSGQGLANSEVEPLKLYFHNNDNGSGYPISISHLEFRARDENGADAKFTELASAIRIFDSRGAVATGMIQDEIAVFNDIGNIIVPPGEDDTVTLSLKLAENIKLNGFSLRITGDDMEAYAIRDSIPQVKVDIMFPGGNPVDIITDPAGLAEMSLAESFGNYPNPFDPLFEDCRFSYYLSQPSDISLRIYTLTGLPVWLAEFRGGDEHCLAGNHSGSSTLAPIRWNGRNGQGYIVNNGIYIAIFEMHSSGEQVRTKVAVVK